MPDIVKYGISYLTVMGARFSTSSSAIVDEEVAMIMDDCLGVPFLTLGSPKCARIRYSRPPPSCFIFHTKADLSGAYWTLPVDAYGSNVTRIQSDQKILLDRSLTLNFGVSASSGTGTKISTLFAVLRLLNCALHFTIYSTLLPR